MVQNCFHEFFGHVCNTFRGAKIVGAGHVLGAWPVRQVETFDEMGVSHKTHAGTRLEQLSSLYYKMACQAA